MRWLLLGLPTAFLAALVLLLTLPAPVPIHGFDPGPAPLLEGVLAPNDRLSRCEVLAADRIENPEELEFDAEGRLYTGNAQGEILRVTFGAGSAEPTVEIVGRPGGRPNGVTLEPGGSLLVSDGYHAAPSRVHPDGRVERVAFLKGQDAAVARDGRIFFPDTEVLPESTSLAQDVLLRIASAAPTGRLLMYDPATGETVALGTGLIWPDGVALARDETFVLVGEVAGYRITRFWLAGPRAGTSERLVENLPGMVDGLAAQDDGTFTVSIALLRNPLIDWFHRHPWWKARVSNLLRVPGFAELVATTTPGSDRGYGLVLRVDSEGRILESLHERGLRIGPAINTAEYWGDHLYLGSLGGRGIARCPRA